MRHGCFLLRRHSLFPPFPPSVQSKQAGQTAVSTSEREREGGGDMQTDGRTELLPSDVSDGPI